MVSVTTIISINVYMPGEFQRENIRRVVDMVQTALFMPPYHFSARDAGLPNALGTTRFENCVDQAHLPLHIFIASSSSMGMQLTQVLTPSQCKERFLSVHRRRREQVGRVFFFSLRLLLIFSQAQVATDRFLSDHRRRQVQVG